MMAGILILTFLVPVIIRAASRAFIMSAMAMHPLSHLIINTIPNNVNGNSNNIMLLHIIRLKCI